MLLTFRLTQMITGVGCFGDYLRHIGREESSQCFSCDSGDEDARRIVVRCQEWLDDRRVLELQLGPNLSLSMVVRRMAGDQECWMTISLFAEVAPW